MTDIDNLIDDLNRNCKVLSEMRSGLFANAVSSSSAQYKEKLWNKQNLISGDRRKCYWNRLCYNCSDTLKSRLHFQIKRSRNRKFNDACDECKEACIKYITNDNDNDNENGDCYADKPLIYSKEYVKEKMDTFNSYCNDCKINMTINDAKIKLTQPNANIADGMCVCLDMFKLLSDEMKEMKQIINSVSNRIDALKN